ncbi:MAG: hypothetical protein AAFW97_00845 [Pseudomonadota bacterium]
MFKVIPGAILAAVAMFIIGFIAYGLLGSIPVSDVGDAEAAAIQSVLAGSMDNDAARTVLVPSGSGEVQQRMYLDGPIAMIHYNPSGFEIGAGSTMLSGFIHMLISALILGAALYTLSGHVRDPGARIAIVALFGLAASFYMNLGNPIWWHHDWLYHGYVFVIDAVSFIVGGAIIARWFLPKHIDSDDRFGAQEN